jgi:glycosyltransferase involved in cell wall biosynthesis
MNGAIQAMAADLGVQACVRFHGWLDPPHLRELAGASHVFLHTSRFETGPVAVLEAAIAGVPTVGTAVGHIAEWAPHAAIAVPVGDDEGLARELLSLLGDEERRVRLAAEAQRRARAQDADWTAARFEALYGEVVSGASGRGPGR